MNTRYTHLPYFVCLMMSFMMAGLLRAMDDNTNAAALASGTSMGEEYVLVTESQQALRHRRSAGRDNNQQYNNLRWELLDKMDVMRRANKETALHYARYFWNNQHGDMTISAQGLQDDMAAAWVTRAQNLGATEEELQQICSNLSEESVRRKRHATAFYLLDASDKIPNLISKYLLSPSKRHAVDKLKNHNE